MCFKSYLAKFESWNPKSKLENTDNLFSREELERQMWLQGLTSLFYMHSGGSYSIFQSNGYWVSWHMSTLQELRDPHNKY